MIRVQPDLTPEKLKPRLERLFEISAGKIRALDQGFDVSQGAPVFTVKGVYTAREWTEWTQGFLYGSALLQYEATGDDWFLEYGRRNTLERMAPQLTNMGVHDHGFNVVSTYGNLLRLAREEKIKARDYEADLYALALKVSGAMQAARWTPLRDGRGFIYSFNGSHSLFADTIRSLRSLALAHRLGHALMGEGGARISLLERLIHHASVTAEFSVYYGEGRDAYDVRGRVAHESLYNVKDGTYRCPSTQQGYSPFSTWTRALAWIMCGYAEELEFGATVSDAELATFGGRQKIEAMMLRAAEATCDYYLEQAAQDGIPYWDTRAPQLEKLGDWKNKPADPFNDYEPVDSSAACIAAQGLFRLGKYLEKQNPESSRRYQQAALTIANTLFEEPYLSTNPQHQGLILHSVYHRPKGWDYVPPNRKIPCGESSMWGDYHARELALMLLREANGEPTLTFFNI
jgi:unsaturated chondroitin disaccharide hydrolase